MRPKNYGPVSKNTVRIVCRRHSRDRFWDARQWDDSVSGLDVVAWTVSDAHNDAVSAEDAYWIGQALVNHGFLRRSNLGVATTSTVSVEAMRAYRRFELASEARYRFDRLSLCPWRLRVDVHAARNLENVHLLKRAGSPYVRCVVGGAVFFETRVVEGELSPVWDESYEVGCKPGERVELQVLDRDAGLMRSQNLGELDLGVVDDMMLGDQAVDDRATETLGAVCCSHSYRCVFRRARFTGQAELPRFLPLTSATGGHGSDSALLAVRARVTKRLSERRPAENVTEEELDGVRNWVVRCRTFKARNVAYDLAETWGLQFCMRARLVVCDKEAYSAMADKDVASGSSDWELLDNEPLWLEAALNRASETVSLVVSERARSDLIERRIAFACLPLRSLPIVVRSRATGCYDAAAAAPTDQRALDAAFFSAGPGAGLAAAHELAFAPPRWIDLERSAGGTRASPLRARNGQILASIWLERTVDDHEDAYAAGDAKLSSRKRPRRARIANGLRRGVMFAALAMLVVLMKLLGAAVVATTLLESCRRLIGRFMWLAVRLPLAVITSLAIAVPLLGLAPRLLGAAFSYGITHLAIARRCSTIHVPEVSAKSIAVSIWLETATPAFEAKIGLPLRPGQQSSLAQGGASVSSRRSSASTWAVVVSVVVRGFKFGNPPGFKRDHLLSIDHFAFDAALPIATLLALPRIIYDVVYKGELWYPNPSANEARREANERRGVSDAARRNAVPAVRFERFDFEGVDLNFEMHHGELNINGITRLLAEAEAFAAADRRAAREFQIAVAAKKRGGMKLPPPPPNCVSSDEEEGHDEDDHPHAHKFPRPNQLLIRVLGARGLFVANPFASNAAATAAQDGGDDLMSAAEAQQPQQQVDVVQSLTDQVRLYSGLSFIEVRARSERAATKASPFTNGEGAWNETLRLQVTDPSTVIQLVVRSESAPIGFAFSWVMTAKWLVSNPTYCDHHTGRLERLAPGQNGMKGWIRLRDRKHVRISPAIAAPELQIELEWVYVPGYYDATKHKGIAKTALEQLTQNSEESLLRVGDLKACRRMLADFPFKVDVWRVTVRDMQLHIKDLFMGKRGQSEVGDGARNAIFLPNTDIGDAALRREADRALGGSRAFGRGVDLCDFLERFFIRGVTPALMRQNAFNAALQQTTSAFVRQLWLGDMLNFSSAVGSSSASSTGPASSSSPSTSIAKTARTSSGSDVVETFNRATSNASRVANAQTATGREPVQREDMRTAAMGMLGFGKHGGVVPSANQQTMRQRPRGPTAVDLKKTTARCLGPRSASSRENVGRRPAKALTEASDSALLLDRDEDEPVNVSDKQKARAPSDSEELKSVRGTGRLSCGVEGDDAQYSEKTPSLMYVGNAMSTPTPLETSNLSSKVRLVEHDAEIVLQRLGSTAASRFRRTGRLKLRGWSTPPYLEARWIDVNVGEQNAATHKSSVTGAPKPLLSWRQRLLPLGDQVAPLTIVRTRQRSASLTPSPSLNAASELLHEVDDNGTPSIRTFFPAPTSGNLDSTQAALDNLGESVAGDDADLATEVTMAGELERAVAYFPGGGSDDCQSALFSKRICWHRFYFELRRTALFFSHLPVAQPEPDVQPPAIRKISMENLINIRLDDKSVVHAVRQTAAAPEMLSARRATIALTWPNQHIWLRLPDDIAAPTLEDWRDVLTSCLLSACRESNSDGLGTKRNKSNHLPFDCSNLRNSVSVDSSKVDNCNEDGKIGGGRGFDGSPPAPSELSGNPNFAIGTERLSGQSVPASSSDCGSEDYPHHPETAWHVTLQSASSRDSSSSV